MLCGAVASKAKTSCRPWPRPCAVCSNQAAASSFSRTRHPVSQRFITTPPTPSARSSSSRVPLVRHAPACRRRRRRWVRQARQSAFDRASLTGAMERRPSAAARIPLPIRAHEGVGGRCGGRRQRQRRARRPATEEAKAPNEATAVSESTKLVRFLRIETLCTSALAPRYVALRNF